MYSLIPSIILWEVTLHKLGKKEMPNTLTLHMENFNDILRKLNTYATQELYCWLENIPNACRKIHLRKVDFTIPKDPSESD